MSEQLFKNIELSRLYKFGLMTHFFKKYGHLTTQKTLLATGGDTTVFNYVTDKDGKESLVLKIVPKNIRFFKHFGKNHSAKDFKKYINRLQPYFIPVEEIIYEDENFFAYTQRKCHLITSDKISHNVVVDLFKLIQFMLVNDILLTDLAPHNLGLIKKQLVVFDYHGLHRLTEHGVIKRQDWWRRLIRNLTRFICGLYCPHQRAEYSLLMQDCTTDVVRKLSNDSHIPKEFSKLVEYVMKEQENTSIPKLCEHLESCIKTIHSHK